MLYIIMKIIDIFLLKTSKNILIIIKKLDSSLITFFSLMGGERGHSRDHRGQTKKKQKDRRSATESGLLNPILGNFLY